MYLVILNIFALAGLKKASLLTKVNVDEFVIFLMVMLVNLSISERKKAFGHMLLKSTVILIQCIESMALLLLLRSNILLHVHLQ